jgi:hypothetical protein
MNNSNEPNEIIKEISILYELSLSIGRSLDLKENCDAFLKTLKQGLFTKPIIIVLQTYFWMSRCGGGKEYTGSPIATGPEDGKPRNPCRRHRT